jgi:hypothetical protein
VENAAIIKGFAQLGAVMRSLGSGESWSDFSLGVTRVEYAKLEEIVQRQIAYNGWFSLDDVRRSLLAQGEWLTDDYLRAWLKDVNLPRIPKRVAIIMAGNIPLVGFHDFLSVLCLGHTAVCKLSSDDKTLLPALAAHLVEFAPELKERIEFTIGPVKEIQAVIATGSNNSTLYFQEYFGKYPHIFRHNRTSVAVLDGSETQEELRALGDDIFSYFGLGCRNVTHLCVPQGYDFQLFFEGIYPYGEKLIHNHKYGNNYDYNRAVYLLNLQNLLDNNFVLLRESTELFSPISMVNYHFYSSQEELAFYLLARERDIQVVVGHDYLPFGQAQTPKLHDYADGVDVLSWLSKL